MCLGDCRKSPGKTYGPTMARTSIISVFLFLLLCSGVQARTITVIQDGTGDFVEIQPALDAVASGDTLLIGPGHFTKLIPSYIPGYAWDVDVCAYVHVPTLTIIGAGVGQTVLGPEVYPGGGTTFSPKCLVWLAGSERHIQGITFRNCYEGIHVTNGPVYVEDCEFLGNAGYGIIWQTADSGGRIRHCLFRAESFDAAGIEILGSGSNLIVENCVFVGVGSYIKQIDNISFIDCEVKDTSFAVQFSAGAQGEIYGTNIHDCSIFGLEILGFGTNVNIHDSYIAGDGCAVIDRNEATFSADNSELQGGFNSQIAYNGVVWFSNSGPAVVHNCDLITHGPLAINVYFQYVGYGQIVHDFTRNYWGTSDAGQVAEWIWDGNDDPSLAATVLYMPMFGGSVGTEVKSFGSVKALFR